MEATLVARPNYQATDLLGPSLAVPTDDPKPQTSQPRAGSDRSTKGFLKYIPRFSLLPARSAERAAETNSDPGIERSKSEPNRQLNRPPETQSGNNNGTAAHQTDHLAPRHTCATTNEGVQSNSARSELDQGEVRIPMLKFLFWKMMRPQKAQRVTEDLPPHEITESVVTGTGTHPTLVVTEEDTCTKSVNSSSVVDSVMVHDPAPSIRDLATTANHDTAAISGAFPMDLLSSISQIPSIQLNTIETQKSPTPAIPESCVSTKKISRAVQPNKAVEEHPSETNIVKEEIHSSRMYSPEQGIFVGKLYELPPPEGLQLEWRQTIRPQLVKNLMTVIASLPQSLTRLETMIEPELCMSGENLLGHSIVTLTPTIWIRCGSIQCRKTVQRVVADLSHIQRFPVHVTLHAPRPASAGQASCSISRDTDPSVVDGLSSVNPSGPAPVAGMLNCISQINHSSLAVRVQSPTDNQHSACGLRVRFSSPNGTIHTSTLGGLVLLDDVVLGLTTAHAIFDHNSDVDGPSDFETVQDRGNHRPSVQPEFEFSVPATVLAANLGSFYFPSRSETILSAISDNEHNHDFALLQLHPERDEAIHNFYQTSCGHQIIDTISRDLTTRAVHIVGSFEDAKPGQLMDGDCVLMDKEGLWETKKIQLKSPLAPGSSGTWVVDGRALLGVITAVYEDEPYAHMIPITSIFSGIESMLSKDSKRAKIEMIAYGRPNARKHDLISNETTSEPSVDKKVWLAKNQIDVQLEALFPRFLMALAIGLDSSSYPFILPHEISTLGSIYVIGCLEGAYLLAFGLTYPILGRLHTLLTDLSNHRALVLLRLACMTTFAAGVLCCYYLTTVQGVVVGRAISGIGAAGSVSGITALLNAYPPGTNTWLGASFLLVYTMARLLGPIIAGAMMHDLGSHQAWNSVLLLNIITTTVAIWRTVASLTSNQDALTTKVSGQRHLNPQKHKLLQVLARLDFFGFISGSSAFISLQFALHLGATQGWNSSRAIALLTANFGVSSALFIFQQSQKHFTAEMLPTAIPVRALSVRQVLHVVYIACWGFSFYPFSFFTPIWYRTPGSNSPIMSAILYLPLASAPLFTCLFNLPFISRRVKKTRDEENRGKTSKGPRTVRSAPKNDTATQKPPAIPASKRSNGGPVIKQKNKDFAAYILVASLCAMALSTGVFLRFKDSISIATILGVHTLFSIGAGLGASQFALSGFHWTAMLSPSAGRGGNSREEDMVQPSLAVFAEMVGGSIGMAAAQAILTSSLSQQMSEDRILPLLSWIRESDDFRSEQRKFYLWRRESGRKSFKRGSYSVHSEPIKVYDSYDESTPVLPILALTLLGTGLATYIVYRRRREQRGFTVEPAADHPPEPEPQEVHQIPVSGPSLVLRHRRV